MVLTEQMKSMKQLSLAETGYLPKAGKQTRKAIFLAEMETVVPWSRLEALITPHYTKKGNGRPPMPSANHACHGPQWRSSASGDMICRKPCSSRKAQKSEAGRRDTKME